MINKELLTRGRSTAVLWQFLLVAISCAALVTGCASSGRNFNAAQTSQISKGVTTEPDLVALFGPPTGRGVHSEKGSWLRWVYVESRVKGETFIPFAGAFIGGADTKTKILTVYLTPAGTVGEYEYEGGDIATTGTTQPDPGP